LEFDPEEIPLKEQEDERHSVNSNRSGRKYNIPESTMEAYAFGQMGSKKFLQQKKSHDKSF
jgi:hypothetical protein